MAKKASFLMSLKASGRKYFVPAVLASCVLLSVIMAVVKPVPHGHRYDFAVELTIELLVIWLVYRVKPGWVFKKAFLAAVLVTGLAVGVFEFVTINPDAEIVHVYRSVFDDLQNGRNPYTSGLTFHRAEFLRPVYGNFNYPPLEIYPYYAAYRITGQWNSTVLASTIVFVQALACLIFLLTFPKVKWRYIWPFIPLFLFAEIHINAAMTLLVTAAILWAVRKNREAPERGYRYLIAVLFGIGLMTKFLIIPLMAAYYAHAFDFKRPRKLLAAAADSAIALAAAVLVMAPFGVVPVIKNTILFNLVLKDRAVLTTFFPNVLSGLFSWANLGWIYPAVAVIVLGLAIATAPRLNLFSAMLTAAFAFLLVSPTPRNQFVPAVFYLAIAGILLNFGEQGATSGVPRESHHSGDCL